MPQVTGRKSGVTIILEKDLSTIKDGEVRIMVESLNWSGRLTSAYRTVSFIITLVGLVYLISIPLGLLGDSKRFQLTDLGVFASILLLNSDKLSKVQLGKEGLNFELVQEIKRKTDAIRSKQGTIEANQNLITTQQTEQVEKTTTLQKTLENFLRNNESIFKKLEDIRLPDGTDTLARSISEYVSVEVGKQIEKNLPNIYDFVKDEIEQNSPKIYEHISEEVKKIIPVIKQNITDQIQNEFPIVYQTACDQIASQISSQVKNGLPFLFLQSGNDQSPAKDG